MINKKILFVSLAANQADFFMRLGDALKAHGYIVGHICFHEPSEKIFIERGDVVFNPYKGDHDGWNLIDLKEYGIQSPSLILGHEKAAYETHNTNILLEKFKRHLCAMDRILDQFSNGQELTVIQELGGFTSVLAGFYSARRAGFDNFFIEPSFFKGRFFLTRNSLQAPKVSDEDMELPNPELKQLLRKIAETQVIVIPNKDRLHYRSAFYKIVDIKNIRRLFSKISSKYLKKEREEFEHIGGHVLRHLRMFLNSILLRGYYYKKIDSGFVYYPLHVPADFALTIRSPEYLDQISLIDYLCRIAPIGRKVVIKEHPALIGAMSSCRLKELLNRHDNLQLLHPSINNHSILQHAAVVITVNSKAGAEGLIYGKPVLVLGDAFYSTCSLCIPVSNLKKLNSLLNDILSKNEDKDQIAIESYFQGVWSRSYKGELYDVTQDNIWSFSQSLIAALKSH